MIQNCRVLFSYPMICRMIQFIIFTSKFASWVISSIRASFHNSENPKINVQSFGNLFPFTPFRRHLILVSCKKSRLSANYSGPILVNRQSVSISICWLTVKLTRKRNFSRHVDSGNFFDLTLRDNTIDSTQRFVYGQRVIL